MDFFKMLKEKNNIILNAGQKEVASHKDGPILAIAVPGSGKTTTMMCRTGFLIEKHGVDPRRILSVTFSRASAVDMKKRYSSIFSRGQHEPEFSTIHSFANRCINRFDGERLRYVNILGIRGFPSQEKLIGAAFKAINKYADPEKVKETAVLIGYAKNSMLDDEEILGLNKQIESFDKVLECYENLKIENSLIDFDDMLQMAHKLLKDSPDCLRFYQDSYDYYQIDEAQDTSKLQHEIFNLLASRSENLLMCGDEDQSIYGWRGAAPGYMLEFGDRHTGAAITRLEKNYRSTKHIVRAMNNVISINENRYEKTMTTDNEEGEPVRVERPESVLEQNRLIAKELDSLDEGEIAAVIYRRNRSGFLMAHELWMANIPFNIEKSRINEFFWKSVFKDVTSFCKLVDNPFDVKSFRQIYHKMGLFINKGSMESLIQNGGLTEANIRDAVSGKKNIESFNKRLREIRRLKHMPVRNLFEELEDGWGYADYLDDAGDAYGYRKNSSMAMFHIMKAMIVGNETPEQYCNRLRSFWTAIANMDGSASVSLSAVHSVKGLEFDSVYVIDLVEDEFPFHAAANGSGLSGGSLEEERCLFYVAGTRAKSRLCLLSPRNFYGENDAAPSEFLLETGISLAKKRVPEPGMKFVAAKDELETGKRVLVNKFGPGIIEKVDNSKDKVSIKIDGKTKAFRISIILQNELIQIGEK
jgi:DNA helicase-2/ATP-dependent DNA helicase PcrA